MSAGTQRWAGRAARKLTPATDERLRSYRRLLRRRKRRGRRRTHLALTQKPARSSTATFFPSRQSLGSSTPVYGRQRWPGFWAARYVDGLLLWRSLTQYVRRGVKKNPRKVLVSMWTRSTKRCALQSRRIYRFSSCDIEIHRASAYHPIGMAT